MRYQRFLQKHPKRISPQKIERAHRLQGNSEISGKRSNNARPYLVAKIVNWEFSKRIKSAFIAENQNGNSRVSVLQIYSKSLTLRRNRALKNEHELKEGDPLIQEYVCYFDDLKSL